MECEVERCPRCSLVCVRLAGRFCGTALLDTLSEIETVADRTTADCTAADRIEVWDVRAVRDLYIRPDEAERLAGELPAREEDAKGRTAVLARTTSQASYGTVLCQSLRPYVRAHRSFYSAEQAARWLGCPTQPSEGSASEAMQGRICLLRSM